MATDGHFEFEEFPQHRQGKTKVQPQDLSTDILRFERKYRNGVLHFKLHESLKASLRPRRGRRTFQVGRLLVETAHPEMSRKSARWLFSKGVCLTYTLQGTLIKTKAASAAITTKKQATKPVNRTLLLFRYCVNILGEARTELCWKFKTWTVFMVEWPFYFMVDRRGKRVAALLSTCPNQVTAWFGLLFYLQSASVEIIICIYDSCKPFLLFFQFF